MSYDVWSRCLLKATPLTILENGLDETHPPFVHTRMRELFDPLFNRKRIHWPDKVVREKSIELLNNVKHGRSVDIVSDIADPLASMIDIILALISAAGGLVFSAGLRRLSYPEPQASA